MSKNGWGGGEEINVVRGGEVVKNNYKLYQFGSVAVIKYHKPCGLNNRKSLSYISGGQKSKIKVSAGLVPSEAMGQISPGSPWFVGNL